MLNRQKSKKDATGALRRREIALALAQFVGTDAFAYTQAIAAGIASEYQCKPTDQTWHEFTVIQYAYNELFKRIASHVKAEIGGAGTTTSILAEIKRQDERSSERPNNKRRGARYAAAG